VTFLNLLKTNNMRFTWSDAGSFLNVDKKEGDLPPGLR
jgi:hypothetical protein